MTGVLSVDADVLERTSRSIVRAAACVADVDHVGFALALRGQFVAQPTTDPVVEELDGLQASSGAGPGVEVVRGSGTLDVPDLAAVPRYAGLAEAAARHGVRGVLAVALTAHDGVLGVLTLYTRSTIGAAGRALADALAPQATVALFGAQRIAGLARAVTSRDVIGQAKGVLMHRDGVDDETAFGMLVEASQTTNIKLVDVAAWLVAQATTGTAPDTDTATTDGAPPLPAPDRVRPTQARQGTGRGGTRR
ncbi:GAF and ANTAR domain-containing protein [Actinomycetospora sp. TBRC 11914]|nr:GAF and ANTAR domain-containing protein [Actinomycetospora sp. TBRC 11914]